MKLVFKIIIGIAVLVIVTVLVIPETHTSSTQTTEKNSPADETQGNLSVRQILALASKNNTEHVWLATEMSEPTLVSEILETKEGWLVAYTMIQSILELSDIDMNLVQTKLESQSMVGEWESVVEIIQTQGISELNKEISEGFITLRVPLISHEGEVGPFGCGSFMSYIDFEIPKTTSVLDSVYKKLFNELSTHPEDTNPSITNIVATQTSLTYDSVEIIDGNVYVYLSGVIMGNHCADPEFRAQVEATAFQFNTVQSLTVFVNNKIFDWCSLDLSDGEGLCPENPQPWIVNQDQTIYR